LRKAGRKSVIQPKDINAAIPLNLLKTFLNSRHDRGPERRFASQSWIYRNDRIYSAPAIQIRVSDTNENKGVTVCDSP
jgi:hypothetical protein